MKTQESMENYLERILILKEKNGSVRSIDIANDMKFTKASVSIAMKKLKENHYIVMDKNGLITLTEEGKAIADKTYEKHKLISELFMSIGVSEKVALEDACRIEHVISDESFQAIKNHIQKKRNS